MEAGMIEGLRRFDASQGSRKLGPQDGKTVDVAGLGVRFMVYSEESGGGFALVERPIPPRALAGPVHRHSREDEYGFVLEGRMGAPPGKSLRAVATSSMHFASLRTGD